MFAMRERRGLDLIAVVAVGGVIGALGRYAIVVALPHTAGTFPSGTFAVNVVGCALIGVLLVYSLEVWPPHRYTRLFLGTGVLGGFTTFSAYALETRDLLADGHRGMAAAYALGSLAAGLLAVRVATVATRRLTGTNREGSG